MPWDFLETTPKKPPGDTSSFLLPSSTFFPPCVPRLDKLKVYARTDKPDKEINMLFEGFSLIQHCSSHTHPKKFKLGSSAWAQGDFQIISRKLRYLLSASYFLGKGRRSIPLTNRRFVKFALLCAWRVTRINCCQVYKFLCWQQLKQHRRVLENVAYSPSDWCCCRSDLREQITLLVKGGPSAHAISTSLDCSSKCSVCNPTENEAVWGPAMMIEWPGWPAYHFALRRTNLLNERENLASSSQLHRLQPKCLVARWKTFLQEICPTFAEFKQKKGQLVWPPSHRLHIPLMTLKVFCLNPGKDNLLLCNVFIFALWHFVIFICFLPCIFSFNFN